MPRLDPVLRLQPRMPRINHSAVHGVLTALRANVTPLDMMMPPESVILARLRHIARRDAMLLRLDLDRLLATTFRPYTELTAH